MICVTKQAVVIDLWDNIKQRTGPLSQIKTGVYRQWLSNAPFSGGILIKLASAWEALPNVIARFGRSDGHLDL